MSRAYAAFILLFFLSTAFAQDDEFRFIRPVHVVQNKRAVKRMPPMDVSTFKPGSIRPVADPPEVAIGERLFMETRFSQYFAANYDGNVNHPLKKGEPTLDQVEVKGRTLRGPFKTRSINCRSCHFVAEFAHEGIGFNRTYADFAKRSPMPAREDGKKNTPRNSMSMVDSFISRDGATLLHADGEFANVESLVKSTMTGRNFGWLPGEQDEAIAHIAKVIREDDGSDIISYRYGGSYTKILAGTDPSIHFSFKLPREYTIDVSSASDQQILDAVAKLVGAYLASLEFARTNDGIHDGSPYDMFLKINGLPQKPNQGETDAQYTDRLRKAVEELKQPKFVDQEEQATWFQYHQQKFNFGPEELEGLKIFLRTQASAKQSAKKPNFGAILAVPGAIVLFGFATRRSKNRGSTAMWMSVLVVCSMVILGGWSKDGRKIKLAAQKEQANLTPHVGNCASCHTAPDFTDRGFHNSGASQEEYDSLHGAGSFARLAIPSYEQRVKQHDRYLPATPQHPKASDVFRSIPAAANPKAADLGMWNIFANPDYPEPQPLLNKLMCGAENCDVKVTLPKTVALFRTPPLRDLEDSSPFMHSGRLETIEDTLRYYIRISALARRGEVRNGAPELNGITIDEQDVKALAAFLRSLNEDYD
ncbi:MAG TPA: hypothetical protein VN577_14425 [Terriglobales bacterium]|nr:hypothetical protein [Terriglobales bacterium]